MQCVVPWILGYLDTWSGFEEAKTAPWPSRGLQHFGKFLELSDKWAGQGCYCFLMRWHSGRFWLIRNELQKFIELKFEFWILTLSMSLRYFGNELYKQGPNTVISFSWRDCALFLFVGYLITHCVPCLGCFLVFILCPIVPSIFGTICCVIFQIYIII